MEHVDNRSIRGIVPLKEKRRIRTLRVRSLHLKGYSMDQICEMEKMSKRDVYLAVNATRFKKKPAKIKSK